MSIDIGRVADVVAFIFEKADHVLLVRKESARSPSVDIGTIERQFDGRRAGCAVVAIQRFATPAVVSLVSVDALLIDEDSRIGCRLALR